MQTGSVKFFNEDKGWGFVVPDDGGADLYLNWRGCRDTYIPAQGDLVQFDIKEFPDNRFMAIKVQLAE
jgi:cold shock protein